MWSNFIIENNIDQQIIMVALIGVNYEIKEKLI